MIMINAWSIRRGIKRVENVQNGRFDSRFPQLSFAFLIFAASPIMSGIVRLTVLYARARANYGNPCKFNKYSYLIELITFLMNQIFQLSQNAKIFIQPATEELDCVKNSLVKFTAIEAQ